MTYLDAAHTILTQSRQPLHYAEITRRALEQGLIAPTGLTPEATMGSRLYTDTKQEDPLFVRVARGTFDLVQRQPGGIDAQVQKINQATRIDLRRQLHAMPFDRFEALIGDLLIEMGFDESTVTVTKRSGDGGIDVTGIYRAAGLTQVNAAVQVKRWKNNIGAPIVTQLRGSLQVHQQGIIITTSDFTKSARSEAHALSKTPIGLINGTELIDLLIKHRVGVEERTLKVIGLDHEWWGELLGSLEEPATTALREGAASIAASTAYRTPSSQPALLHVAGSASEASDGPTGRKPSTVTVLGETHHVTSWKELLLAVCALLATRHPDNFASRATMVKGRKRHYFAATSDTMINPAQIPDVNLYVETNLSAKDIVKLSSRLLDMFDYDPDTLIVTYA